MKDPRQAQRTSIGGYEILTEISAGGMGRVLLGRRSLAQDFEKLAAIKIIHKHFSADKELRAMFHDEARLVARLGHPAIAQVYDFGEDGDSLYLVMEYVAGVSFSSLLHTEASSLIACKLVAEVLRGLHAAHELRDLHGELLGVVHRDVSPDNLMLTYDGRVKILDFGIALVRDRRVQQTQLGQIKGKPAYMSPEQMMGGMLDRRCDVFAAAVVLHELLTGKHLFTGDSLFEIALAVGQANVAPPSATKRDILPELDALVLRGLKRDPAERFATAQEMADALDAIVVQGGGGTSLERYAAAALASERFTHSVWLKRAMAGELLQSGDDHSMGRPSGQSTAVTADDAATTPAGNSLVPMISAARSTKRDRLVLAGLGLAVLCLGMLYGLGLFTAPVPRLPVRSVESLTPPRELAAHDVMPRSKDLIIRESSAQPALPAPPGRDTDTVRRATGHEGSKAPRTVGAPKKNNSDAAADMAIAAPAVFGKIRTGATPYANVRIDGKVVGDTPESFSVPVGKHLVEYLSPADRHVIMTRTIEVPENGAADVRLFQPWN